MSRAYSNSELQCYKNCPLQWRFKYDLGLHRIDDDSGEHHLRFGAAFHAGLEQLYRGNGLLAARDAFVVEYPTQLDVNDKAKTQANGILALRDYAARWREDDGQWRVLAIESRSDAESGYSVKPDMIVESVEHGGVWLVDHKTTGRYLNYDYWAQYEPNSQITHYLDYAQSEYGDIEGFIINAIGFRYRERAYKGEPAGFWTAFERQTFNRNASQLQFERRSRIDWVAELERSRESQFWRSNTEACRFCSYKSLCAAGWTWEDDAELIQLTFRQVCDAMLGNDAHCALNRDHEGDHNSELPRHDATAEIEVEV